MTITFPRDVPVVKRWIARLDLAPNYELDQTGDGGQLARELGPTLWTGMVTISSLYESQARAFEAWAVSVQTPPQPFYLADTFKKYAASRFRVGYAGLVRAGGGAFDGTCTLGNVTSNKIMPLSGLPAGFILSPGDSLAFDYSDTIRAYHMIVAGGTADGGGNVSVEVRAHVRAGWTVGATVNLLSPAAKMLMVPGSFSPSPSGHLQSFTFKAAQSLLP